MLREKTLQKLEEKGLSRAELIRRVGMNRDPIQRWLQGKTDPHLRTIEPVLRLLGIRGVTTSRLLGAMRKDGRGQTAWAHALDLHPAAVAHLLAGSRGLSVSSAERVIAAIGLKIK